MPSQLHEALLLLFRNRPLLAPELLREALHVELPTYTEARIESADLTDIQPTAYRADLVVLLLRGKPVYGIVVEVQLRSDARKRYSWPAYAAGLRARFRCPVCVLVYAADDAVARWAARTVDIGGGNRFTPLVLGPSGVPVIDRKTVARADPELAVLSAMAHGRSARPDRALRIALAAIGASVGLDADRSTLYFDLVIYALGAAARKALREMDPQKYEFQSDFAKRYFGRGLAKGRAEGKAEGKAELVAKLLVTRFGPLPRAARVQLRQATLDDLDVFAERVLAAATLDEVLAPTAPPRRRRASATKLNATRR